LKRERANAILTPQPAAGTSRQKEETTTRRIKERKDWSDGKGQQGGAEGIDVKTGGKNGKRSDPESKMIPSSRTKVRTDRTKRQGSLRGAGKGTSGFLNGVNKKLKG